MTKQSNHGNQLILAIILGILTYWLFAQSLLNIAPHVQQDYQVDMSIVNIAVSLTSLMSGIFIVVMGGLADKLGRVKMTYIGLILSIVGSAALIISNLTFMLLLGRILQGLSAACLMPATIALINQNYHDAARQKALSYWSFGSYGGTGFASLFAGVVATFVGWRWIFILSILFACLAMVLLRGTPESRDESAKGIKFDIVGIVIFLIMMVSINVVITQGTKFGLTHPFILTLDVIFILTIVGFYLYEKQKQHPFIDFSLFNNRVYIGTTIANLLVNTVIGSLAMFNIYAQQGIGLSAAKAGLLTIPYMIGSLLMIRIGEKYMQKHGPQVPLMLGPISIGVGILLLSIVTLPFVIYAIVALIGFSLIGLGLGFFATPALSTAVSNAPEEKVGMASGIIKMTSTLGAAFGIAVVTTVYTSLVSTHTPSFAATIAFISGATLVGLAFLAAWRIIPNQQIKH